MRPVLKNKFYGIILLLMLCGATNRNDALKVSYIGNCGFLYESNSAKVLIDPFGTAFGNFFYLPSKNTQTNIIEGKAPFNNIDLLLITHIHGDHFNVSLAENFLLRNNKAKMICPTQVYKQMKDSCAHFIQIESQIISPQIAMGESKKITFHNISVTVIKMQHGTDRSLEGLDYSNYTDYEKTENFGYLIRIDNKTVFHQGDGCLKINTKAIHKIDSPVTIAHLSYFDWDSLSLGIVMKDLQANKIIFMHGTKPAKELQTEQFKQMAPQLVFFMQELESKTFD